MQIAAGRGAGRWHWQAWADMAGIRCTVLVILRYLAAAGGGNGGQVWSGVQRSAAQRRRQRQRQHQHQRCGHSLPAQSELWKGLFWRLAGQNLALCSSTSSSTHNPPTRQQLLIRPRTPPLVSPKPIDAFFRLAASRAIEPFIQTIIPRPTRPAADQLASRRPTRGVKASTSSSCISDHRNTIFLSSVSRSSVLVPLLPKPALRIHLTIGF
ncbi:hypothetical protein F4780DRAFT_56337 [Xylariomycetidae sp. FL0641]|nr:hypothetical protein F4780DRAFT_56337 [Xylariomycetidae sp. FL0641]